MATRNLGIIMNGVTGRMGTNQHLIRSIVAIRQQGGVPLPDGDALFPDPILVGRSLHPEAGTVVDDLAVTHPDDPLGVLGDVVHARLEAATGEDLLAHDREILVEQGEGVGGVEALAQASFRRTKHLRYSVSGTERRIGWSGAWERISTIRISRPACTAAL